MNNITINQFLHDFYIKNQQNIEDWFAAQYKGTYFSAIYSSVDVRNAGYKIAPVDTNLFPAGFNNLSDAGIIRASEAFMQAVQQRGIECKKLLLISENHSRNLPYFANLQILQKIIEQCGIEVKIARFDLRSDETINFEQSNLQMQGVSVRAGKLIAADGFTPDLVLLNNDLSSGMQQILLEASQPVLPNPYQGWFARRKSSHFSAYNRIVGDFAATFNLDSWLLSTYIHQCGEIDFKERKGLECVAIGVDKIIHAIRAKHQQYNISSEPYVYIKADSGTYGMGIMTVHSGDELLEINKKERNKMNVIKEGVKNEEVIIQEGVPTLDLVAGSAAEPLAYLVGGKIVDIFWRSNPNRDAEISLNAAGMEFSPFSDSQFAAAYSVKLIARLASLATAFEDYREATNLQFAAASN